MANFIEKATDAVKLFFKKNFKKKGIKVSKKGKSIVDPGKKKQSKPRKKIKKICKYCLREFFVTRSDAKYCSDSCKQSVYEKGGDVNRYQCPAEHFFLDILKEIVGEMLEKEYQRIYMQTLIEWRAYLDVGRHLYTKYIPKDSQFTNIYFNEVLPTFDGIGKLFSQSSQNFIAYDLNPEYRERWQWVIDSLRK